MIICVFLPIGEIPSKNQKLSSSCLCFCPLLVGPTNSSRYCQKLSPSCLEVSSRGRCRVVDVQHLLHHEETRVPLVVARDSKAKLLVDVDRCLWKRVSFKLPLFWFARPHLVVVPHVGDDVVHVPLLRLLQHPLHQLLGHPLPGEHVHNPESRCWGWAWSPCWMRSWSRWW